MTYYDISVNYFQLISINSPISMIVYENNLELI
jgi:hypothetical protein